MLSGKIDSEYWDNSQRASVFNLVSDLRHELDTTKQAIQEAKARYSQTSFTVEKGFLEAVTSLRFPELAAAEKEEERRLAEEAKRMLGLEDTSTDSTDSTALVNYSERPIDEQVIELDFAILRAIKNTPHFNMRDLIDSLGGQRISRDSVGGWFAATRSLLTKFQGVLVNHRELFEVLGIPPTDDETQLVRAYRVIANQTHPDKTSHLPPEEQMKAVEHFIKATEAFQNLRAQIGNLSLDRLSPIFHLGRISQLFVKETAS